MRGLVVLLCGGAGCSTVWGVPADSTCIEQKGAGGES